MELGVRHIEYGTQQLFWRCNNTAPSQGNTENGLFDPLQVSNCSAAFVTVCLQLQGRFCAAKRGKYRMLHPHASKLTDNNQVVVKGLSARWLTLRIVSWGHMGAGYEVGLQCWHQSE